MSRITPVGRGDVRDALLPHGGKRRLYWATSHNTNTYVAHIEVWRAALDPHRLALYAEPQMDPLAKMAGGSTFGQSIYMPKSDRECFVREMGASNHLAGKGTSRVDEICLPPFAEPKLIAGSLAVRSGRKSRPALLQKQLLIS